MKKVSYKMKIIITIMIVFSLIVSYVNVIPADKKIETVAYKKTPVGAHGRLNVKGTKLVDAGDIHYEPFGIYPGTKKTLDDLEDGDTIAVPNDTTNEARALLLLQDNGVIALKDGAGLEATVKDIEENPKNIQIEELEAAQVSRVKDEVAFVVLNGNYALQAGYSVSKDSIAHETSDSEAAKTYVNIIAVKEGNEDNEAVKALVDVLKSDEIKDYINETYDGAVVPFEESADSDKAEAVDATADAEEDTAAEDAE